MWNYQKNNKRVRFHDLTRVILIPKMSELYDSIDIWWSESDKVAANAMMYCEIKTLQRIHPTMTMKQAMKLLYQPDNLTRYDVNNFVRR
jgi:hypothetical protein